MAYAEVCQVKPVIGILAHREKKTFHHSRFYRDLIREGERLGALVYVFSHFDLLENERKIRGFKPSPSGGWIEGKRPWPDVVVDFCHKLYKPFRDMRRRKDLFEYANHKFTYKWKAMQLFAESDAVKKWIPETAVYSPKRVRDMLERHSILYVKPGNGTGGHSVLKVGRGTNGFVIYGRMRSGKLIRRSVTTVSALCGLLDRWVATQRIRSGNFMVQQGLDLQLIPGRLVDVRLFVQKNGEGKWTVTGKVLRVGGKNSPTTNLVYGDGKALRFHTFMAEKFGAEKAKAINRECDEMALSLMDTVERRFGPMIEFGLDVGIDVHGRVWLIEANPKPSHNAFLEAKEWEAYRKSIRLPIQYAIYLANRKKESGDSH
jgi:hypothetical protein